MKERAGPLRIAIVEDESLFRGLLRSTLSRIEGIEICFDLGSAEEALERLPADWPDVVLTDIDLGEGLDGITLALKLREKRSDLAIVILSYHREAHYLDALPKPLIRSWAYLLKQSATDIESLERAIRGAASGLVIFDSELIGAIQEGASSLARLGARPAQILRLIAQGYSNSAIASRLHLSEKSVERLVGQLYLDMGLDVRDPAVNPRVQASLRFLKQGLS